MASRIFPIGPTSSFWPDWARPRLAAGSLPGRRRGRPTSSLALQRQGRHPRPPPGPSRDADLVAGGLGQADFASSAAPAWKSPFQNDLPVPLLLDWRGLDGVPAAEPLLVADATSARRKAATFDMPLRHAGTHFCDLRLLGDGQGRPSRALASDRRGKPGANGRSRRDSSDRGLAAARRTEPRSVPGSDPKDAAGDLHRQRADFCPILQCIQTSA